MSLRRVFIASRLDFLMNRFVIRKTFYASRLDFIMNRLSYGRAFIASRLNFVTNRLSYGRPSILITAYVSPRGWRSEFRISTHNIL